MHTKIYVLNLFDCAITLWLAYMFGTEIEGNIFGLILIQSPILTIIFKAIVVGLAVLILHQYRHIPIVKIVTQTLLVLYILITIYHFIIIGSVIKIYADSNLL